MKESELFFITPRRATKYDFPCVNISSAGRNATRVTLYDFSSFVKNFKNPGEVTRVKIAICDDRLYFKFGDKYMGSSFSLTDKEHSKDSRTFTFTKKNLIKKLPVDVLPVVFDPECGLYFCKLGE